MPKLLHGVIAPAAVAMECIAKLSAAGHANRSLPCLLARMLRDTSHMYDVRPWQLSASLSRALQSTLPPLVGVESEWTQPLTWISSRSTTQMHHDTSDNLLCVLVGSKRLRLFPPSVRGDAAARGRVV